MASKANDRVVLLLGAGSTVADCMNLRPPKLPPLDRGFFAAALRTHGPQLLPVRQYMQEHYGIDIGDPLHDSLESIMVAIYTDVFDEKLVVEAFVAFRTLVKVFLFRLANTTNPVSMGKRFRLYRLIVKHLERCSSPEDLTIITFNQDIQIEKALDAIGRTKARAGRGIFTFPGCYRLLFKGSITGPTGGRDELLFGNDKSFSGTSLLKLHGSLNWYSVHNTPNPSRHALFDERRVIRITRPRTIHNDLTISGRTRARFTFPIIIPPVIHKSGILHPDLRPVWSLAEEKLREAARVVVMSYSCPANDWGSANLIARSLNSNSNLEDFASIDPDPRVALRYVGLASLRVLHYFPTCDDYLNQP